MRVLGTGELLLSALEAKLGETRHGRLELVEGLLGNRLRMYELLAHAGVLGSLPRKEEGYLTHVVAPLSTFSAPPTRSSTISAADWRLFTRPAI